MVVDNGVVKILNGSAGRFRSLRADHIVAAVADLGWRPGPLDNDISWRGIASRASWSARSFSMSGMTPHQIQVTDDAGLAVHPGSP